MTTDEELLACVDSLCKAAYDAGKESGLSAGKQSGYLAGNKSGFISGKKLGHADGAKSGYTAGEKVGYADGETTGRAVGYSGGKRAGYLEGGQAGYAEGEQAGYAKGKQAGHVEGEQHGYMDGAYKACGAMPCFGLKHDGVAGLYGKTSGGCITKEYLFVVYQTNLASSGFKPAATLSELRIHDPTQYAVLESRVREYDGARLYECTGSSLKATLCNAQCNPEIQSVLGTYCCAECAALLFDTTLRQRSRRPCNQPGAKSSVHARQDSLTVEQKDERMQYLSKKLEEEYFQKEQERRKRLACERKIRRLESKLRAALDKGKYPKFIRAFQSAFDAGVLPAEQLQNILNDIAKSLLGKHRWSNDSKSFYSCLLNSGNPHVTKFVSLNLLGMDVRTVERDRAARSHEFLQGRARANVKHVAQMYRKYGLVGIPCGVVEDATTLVMRLDCILVSNKDTGEEEVWIEGFLEPFKVESLEMLQTHFSTVIKEDGGVARYVYVWTIVPLIPNAPYWPVFMIGSDNKFTAEWVYDWWEFIVAEFKLEDIPLLGFNHDGDSRCRKADHQVLKHGACDRIFVRRLDGSVHPYMYLSIGKIHDSWVLAGEDYFHVQMRVRRQLLDLKRRMALGRNGLARAHDLEGCPHLLSADLRFSDKQNWAGVCRIFSKETVDWLWTQVKNDSKFKPTLAYVNFGYRLLRMITGDNTPLEGKNSDELEVLRKQAVEDASFCLCFVLTWRYWLHKPAKRFHQPDYLESGYGVELMFTRETFLDIVVMCQVRILMVVFYREHFPKCRIFGDRFSSRFAEYIFQFARMAETNSPLFGMLGFKRHLKHFWLMTDMAADGNVKMPPSKRGVPNDISRVDISKWAAPPGWHLTDKELCDILDAQMDTAVYAPGDCKCASECSECTCGKVAGLHIGDCVYWWVDVLECDELLEPGLLEGPDNFFSALVKHFGIGDLWGAGLNSGEVETGREDHDDADDPAVEVVADSFDSREEASAADVFASACRQVESLSLQDDNPLSGGNMAGGPNTAVRKLYRDCCDATIRFNSDLVRQAQDRKFRF